MGDVKRVEAKCPACGQFRQVRGDGTFAKHSVGGFFGKSKKWSRRPCVGAGTSAKAALRDAERQRLVNDEDEARRAVERERPRFDEAKKWMDRVEANLTEARAAIAAFDAQVQP